MTERNAFDYTYHIYNGKLSDPKLLTLQRIQKLTRWPYLEWLGYADEMTQLKLWQLLRYERASKIYFYVPYERNDD